MSIKLTFVKQFLAFFSGFRWVWWCVGWMGLCRTPGLRFNDVCLKCKDFNGGILKTQTSWICLFLMFSNLILQGSLSSPIISSRMSAFCCYFRVWWLFTHVLVTQLAGPAGPGWGLVVFHGWFIHTVIKFTTLHSRPSHLVMSKWIWTNSEGEDRCQENGVWPQKIALHLPLQDACRICRIAMSWNRLSENEKAFPSSFLMLVTDEPAGYFKFVYRSAGPSKPAFELQTC